MDSVGAAQIATKPETLVEKEEEIAAEVVATGEGMPAGESDELPPKAATAGE
jgi:hypothetical protein